MDGIDTSIYGQLNPPQSPNLLGMGYQAAAMANAMNQNKMFQLQLQSRQGIADISRNALNPDGSMDYNKLSEGLFLDPRTAPFAAQIVTNLRQQQLLTTENTTKYIEQRHEMFGNATEMLTQLLANGNPTQKDGIAAISKGLGSGLFDYPTAIQVLKGMPNDTIGADGKPYNATIKAWAKSQLATTEQGQHALNNFMGTWQTLTSQGGGTYGILASPQVGAIPIAGMPSAEPTTIVGTGMGPKGNGVAVGQEQTGPRFQTPGAGGGMAPLVQLGGQDMGGALGGQGLMGGGGAPQQMGAPQGGGAPGVAPGQMTVSPLAAMPTGQALDHIQMRESGGNNVPNAQGSGAEGYFQIMPATWSDGKKLAGIPAGEYDRPMAAPYDVQRKVAEALYEKYGEAPWKASAQPGTAMAPPPGQQPESKAAQIGDQGNQAGGQGTSSFGYTTKLAPQLGEYLKGTGPVADYGKGLQERQDSERQIGMTLKEMHDAMQYFTPGVGKSELLAASRALDAMGLRDQADALLGQVKSGGLTATAAAQIFNKLAMPFAIGQIKAAGGGSRPTQMIEQGFINSNPNIGMTPEAINGMFNFYNHVMDIHSREYNAFNKWTAVQKDRGGDGLFMPQFSSWWQDQLKQQGALDFSKQIGDQ